jgi:hypothetical protein
MQYTVFQYLCQTLLQILPHPTVKCNFESSITTARDHMRDGCKSRETRCLTQLSKVRRTKAGNLGVGELTSEESLSPTHWVPACCWGETVCSTSGIARASRYVVQGIRGGRVQPRVQEPERRLARVKELVIEESEQTEL